MKNGISEMIKMLKVKMKRGKEYLLRKKKGKIMRIGE
jgi:hypothetical protein